MSVPTRTSVEAVLMQLFERGAIDRSQVAELLGASERLIVYGSLAPGGVNHHRIASLSGTWRAGWLTGELVQTGWGAELGHPALTWDPHGARIPAHLFESPELPAIWDELDAFEGEGYQRIIVPFSEAESSWVVGQVYANRARPARLP